jgi:hypothetical protein
MIMRIAKKEEWFPGYGERNYLVSCPFHKESTPSCVIMPKKGTFHCFGCGTQGYMGTDDTLWTEDHPEEK